MPDKKPSFLKIHKSNISGFLLCNGDETYGSWKLLLNTNHAFRGSLECFAQGNCKYLICESLYTDYKSDILTGISVKKREGEKKNE